MDLERLGRQFQTKLRAMYRMDERAFHREVLWLQAQPSLPKDLERSLLRLLREVVAPAAEPPVADLLAGLPLVQDSCFRAHRRLRLLGAGAYGKVFLVQDNKPPFAMFAIKEIDLQSLGPRYVPKLKNELALAAKAGEAGIGPRLYEAYLCDDRLYLRMEYLEGLTLDEFTERHLLGPQETRRIQEAVAELHRLGIVHQDLHGGNILLQEGADGGLQVRIIDYGFAETTQTLARTEKEQVRLYLQELEGSRDEDLVRRWAIYRLVHEGAIKVPSSSSSSSSKKESRRGTA